MRTRSQRRYINDVLPSETIPSTFKNLETKEVVKAREICKLWLKLVDETKTFWRILKLLEGSLEEIQSTLDQFDEKSGSTLEEISFAVKREQSQDFNQLANTILKSNQSLQVVIITLKAYSSHVPQEIKILADSLLLGLPHLVHFRSSNDTSKVQLLSSNTGRPGILQTLWIPTLKSPPYIDLRVSHPNKFQALSSLKVDDFQTYSTWRSVLSHCSQSLKHLSCVIHSLSLEEALEKEEEVLPLQIPRLEVLELREAGGQFPL